MSTSLVNNFHRRATAPPRVPPEQDDATLVAAAVSGQDQAFGVLFRRHSRRILAAAWRITGNREDARDVAQETFVKAFRYLESFERKSSFSTWLTRIAINEALMWLRRRRWLSDASTTVPIEDEKTAFPREIPDSGPGPETSYSQQERALLLSKAINRLTPGVRKAIELRELAELSTEETARALGISVQAVKSRLFHGRRKLRGILKPYVESTDFQELKQHQ